MNTLQAIVDLLPIGWCVHTISPHTFALESANGAAVSIDTKGRFFKLGYGISPPRPFEMAKKYRGRGWLARLVQDAIDALNEATRPRRLCLNRAGGS